jgi:hypothetical protein
MNGKIFKNNLSDNCQKFVSLISAFICVHLRLIDLKPVHHGYSKKWSEFNL